MRNGNWKLTLFLAYHGQMFEFCGPKTNDANMVERKENHCERQVNSADYFNDRLWVVVHTKR